MSTLPEVSGTLSSPSSPVTTTGLDLQQDLAGQEGWSTRDSIKDGSSLPSLPDLSLERRKFRCRILDESSVQSARLDSREYTLRGSKEDDICRGVYKRQAHSFFSELKEAFAKEAAALRKQAAKAVAKSTSGSESGSGSPDEIAAAITELRAQVAAMHQGLATLQQAGDGTEDGSFSGGQSRNHLIQERNVLKAWFSTVNERITRQQEELKAITRHLRGESAAVKRIARSHTEEMKQEVTHTCLAEVGKLCKDASESLTENTMRPVVTKILEKELAPRLHELQAEISLASSGFSTEMRELIQRVNTAITTQTLLEQRTEEIAENQRAGSWALEQLSEELKSEHGDLHIRVGGVEVRCDSVELRCDTSQRTVETLEMNFQKTQSDLNAEQETRTKANEDLAKELGTLNDRTETLLEQSDSHCIAQKKLLQQLTDAATSLEETQKQVFDSFKSQADVFQEKLQTQIEELRNDVDDLRKKVIVPVTAKPIKFDDEASTTTKVDDEGDDLSPLSASSTVEALHSCQEKLMLTAAVSIEIAVCSPSEAKPDQTRPIHPKLRSAAG